MAQTADWIAFDVNETLLDLAALDDAFAEAFGDSGARRRWFTLILLSGMTGTIVGAYRTFGEVGAASLDRLAASEGVALSDGDRRRILGGMRRLPPHPEVADALARLRNSGYRCAALSNSTLDVIQAQLDHAGLAPLFHAVLSADTTGRLKPHASVYREAAKELGVTPDRMWMIAAHDWDVAGAQAAGCHGGLVVRGGAGPNALFAEPDLVETDLAHMAAALDDRLARLRA